MRTLNKLTVILLLITASVFAQGPEGRKTGFGLILGDPTGGTLKYWTTSDNALNFTVGNSYFGSIRIGGDYLWHFDAFNSKIVNMYAGPGVAIGFGEGNEIVYKRDGDKFYVRDDNEAGFALRAAIGVNVIPRDTPIEIFFEVAPLVGITPDFGSAIDAALGIRFYP